MKEGPRRSESQLPILAFTIYYGDGSVYDNQPPERWGTLPVEGVQAVIWWHPDGYTTLDQGREDPYRLPGQSEEKIGTLIADEDYLRIWNQTQARLQRGR